MTADEREAWLRALVTRISGHSAAQTDLDDDLSDAVGLDSLGRLEVLAAIEDEFDFRFEDNDVTNIRTLAQALGLVDQRLHRIEAEAP